MLKLSVTSQVYLRGKYQKLLPRNVAYISSFYIQNKPTGVFIYFSVGEVQESTSKSPCNDYEQVFQSILISQTMLHSFLMCQ